MRRLLLNLQQPTKRLPRVCGGITTVPRGAGCGGNLGGIKTMFAYKPTVNDESGAIRGQGIVNSAQMNAQAKVQLANDIGGALVSLAGAYGQMQGTKAKGKNFKKFMGMAGETFGFDENQLSSFTGMDDYDAGMMLDNFGSWMPSMANAQLGRRRMGVQQNAPLTQQNIDNANLRAEEGENFDGTVLP
jgi:hypothetical protein